MSFTMPIELKREFTVTCPYDKVFEVLSDVPRSVSHFPKVEKLENMGGNVWMMASGKIGIGKYALQTAYACDYSWSKEEGWVKWAPVGGVGNAKVTGQWTITDKGGSVHVVLDTRAEAEVPLPKLAKALVAPLAMKEFDSTVSRYIENLKKTFGAV
jgi:carbon monoxide dehydrogenase subunit G